MKPDMLLKAIRKLALQKSTVIVAIDGRSGVGKSTISLNIAEHLGGTIINADDFYVGADEGNEANWFKKDPQEKVKTVIDYLRLQRDVLSPLLVGHTAEYHPFDFQAEQGLAKKIIEVRPAKVILIDGVYSAFHLRKTIDLSVLIECPDRERRKRLINREGEEFMLDWHAKWDEAENYYFSQLMTRDRFDFILNGERE